MSENISSEYIDLNFIVDANNSGKRLDQVLANLAGEYSRSRLQAWVKQGNVQVNGKLKKNRDKVAIGDEIILKAKIEAQLDCKPQNISLDVLYEDEHLLIIDKPAGLVVHPAAGNPDGTLQNALLFHDPELIKLPRAGIVHRLDKDTSGVMMVAKSLLAHKKLVDDLQRREIKREYRALIVGRPTAGGTVDAAIGRHPRQRTKMAVVLGGKRAVTHYRIEEKFRIHSLLKVNLETGRTHQIRVHMKHIHLPIVGDPVYNPRPKIPPDSDETLKQALQQFPRQALHAFQLNLCHPASAEEMSWQAPMPGDMASLIQLLRDDRNAHEK